MNDAFGKPQTIVLLGGTSDIALAFAEQVVAERCRTVVLVGRDRTGLEAASRHLLAVGASAAPVVEGDATDVAGAGAVLDRAFDAAGGHVDVLVVAVGLLGDQQADEGDPARVAEVTTVNFTWPAAVLARAAERLGAQGHGRILVLSSVAGVRVRRANYVYGAAKAGLDGYALGLSEALRGTGVTLQVVRPGFVHSKMTEGLDPAPFATTPDVVARAMVGALTGTAQVVWVPGALRLMFGVLRNVPQAAWRRLPG